MKGDPKGKITNRRMHISRIQWLHIFWIFSLQTRFLYVLGASRFCHSVIVFRHFHNFLCYGTKYYLLGIILVKFLGVIFFKVEKVLWFQSTFHWPVFLIIFFRYLCSTAAEFKETPESTEATEYNETTCTAKENPAPTLPHMLQRKGMGTPVIEENIEGKDVTKYCSCTERFSLKLP